MLERPESKKEYDPENYLNTLPRLFAHNQVQQEMKELENTPEHEMTDAEYGRKHRELEKKLLSDEEHQRLLDASALQLQNDINALLKNNSNTLESILKSREEETKELMQVWSKYGFPEGGMIPPDQTDRKAVQERERVSQSLRNILQEIAEKNGWKISFLESSQWKNEPTCTWRMEQEIYVYDGKRTVTIAPTLYKFEDGSALGDYQIPNMDLSHLRKHIVLLEGDKVDTKNPDLKTNSIIYIENGWPDIDRMPSKEEIAFLEKVIAAYY